MGSHLAEYYLSLGHEVHGFVRQRSDMKFLKVNGVISKVHLHMVDIRDPFGTGDAVKEIEPMVIHHLAALTYVPYSWKNPQDTMETNINGTVNMLEAARRNDCVIHFAGSSEEYGIVRPEDTPIKESHPLVPHSPYGVAKVAGENLCKQYFLTYGTKTIITRAFNHEGPRRGKEFIGPIIARQAIEIKEGKRKNFTLGNINAVRDMTDYRDMVEAYALAVVKCDNGEPYNISSGVGYAIKDMVAHIKAVAEIPDAQIEVSSDRVRPTDIPVLIGNSTKFRERTGWKPKHIYSETLNDIYEAFSTWRHDELLE